MIEICAYISSATRHIILLQHLRSSLPVQNHPVARLPDLTIATTGCFLCYKKILFIMSNNPPPPTPAQLAALRLRQPPATYPTGILNTQSRRHLSGTNAIFGTTRTVSFPDNPVTMSQSPPRASQAGPSEEAILQRGRSSSRSSSLPPTIRASSQSTESTSGGSHERRSVKHLTCFWWKEKGACKYSEKDCLYAHSDTGKSVMPKSSSTPQRSGKVHHAQHLPIQTSQPARN